MESNLLKAIQNNNFEKVEDILSQGKVNVNAQDENGRTALYTACWKGKSAIAKLVLEKGGDPNITKHDGTSPLYIACDLNNLDCVQLLCNYSKADLNARRTTGTTPIFISSQRNHADCLKMLIKAGANTDIARNTGETALYIACEKNHADCVKMLIDAGADINLSNNALVTPAIIASQYNCTECLKMLIEAKVDLDIQDVNGSPALHAATRCGNLRCVNLLVEGGAAIDVVDSGGFSPLCYASQKGKEEIAASLIKAGADPAISGWNGNNGLHLAAWGGKDTVFSNSVWLDCFCSSAMQINKPNYYGYTPLHLAALGKQTSTVQFLLNHGADINLQTNFGDTALHCAVMGGNNSCIEIITRTSNLDGSLTNVYGLTAADLFCQKYPDQSLPKLMQEKVNLTDVCQLPVKKFVEVAKLREDAISLKNVKLIKREHFLKAGEIPHYDICEAKNWHLTAEDVHPSNKVLFLSHRWGSQDYPDPDGAQYNIAVNFLDSPKGQDIDFIWADYSCICQNKESELFVEHLKNIPTAVWTATHFLIIPKLVQDAGVAVTHLKDYLGRGWCVLEAMAGVMTGTECHAAFQVGKYISCEQFDRPEGAASNLGFYQSYVKVFNRLIDQEHPDFMNADKSVLQGELWNFVEPCAIIGLLIKACNSTRSEVQNIVQKALNLALTLEDILSAPEEITKIWNLMGQCKVEADKVPVMNLMMFIGYYSINMPRSVETASDSFATEESKETESRETEQGNAKEAPVDEQKDGRECCDVCGIM